MLHVIYFKLNKMVNVSSKVQWSMEIYNEYDGFFCSAERVCREQPGE